jgi:hypothetical protein
MLVLHSPAASRYACTVQHAGEARAAGSAPTLLHVPAAAEGEGPEASVLPSPPHEATAPPSLREWASCALSPEEKLSERAQSQRISCGVCGFMLL